jgi:hypothetical protein
MKRRRISYSRKRKYEMGFCPHTTKKQLIYNLEVIDRENEQYHVFMYF